MNSLYRSPGDSDYAEKNIFLFNVSFPDINCRKERRDAVHYSQCNKFYAMNNFNYDTIVFGLLK